MLDGLISKDDLKNQTEWYNEEIKQLNQQVLDSEQENKVKSRQANAMKEYISALDEIMDMDSNNELVYKEILDHIDIHKNYILDIWLKCIPFAIRLKVKPSGKGEYFKTEIIETSFIENEMRNNGNDIPISLSKAEVVRFGMVKRWER